MRVLLSLRRWLGLHKLSMVCATLVCMMQVACNNFDQPESSAKNQASVKSDRRDRDKDKKQNDGNSSKKSQIDKCFQITNGLAAKPSDWPAVVLIKNFSGNSFTSCTATFVGKDTLISAAHCLRDDQVNGAAPAGKMIAVVDGNEVAVSRVHFPRWAGASNVTVQFDLAVLQLEKAVGTAHYPVATKSPEIDEKFLIVGYGVLVAGPAGPNSGNPNLDLYYGTNKIAGLDYGLIWSYGESGTKISSLRGENSVGAPGDSGGPLIIDKTLVGVESFVSGTLDVAMFMGPAPSLSANPSPATFQSDAMALGRRIPKSSEIEREVRSGRQLSQNAHMNLTSQAYQDWLRDLDRQGIDIRFADDVEPPVKLVDEPPTVVNEDSQDQKLAHDQPESDCELN